jgi:hypothetical protein
MDAIPVQYHGCELSAIVTHRAGEFFSMLLIEKPGGRRHAIGPFRPFANAHDAEQFAIDFGKAKVDGA